MKRFFIIILATVGLQGLLLLVSCDRPAPPDYDESKNQTLSKLCQFLRNEQYEQAIALLKNIEDTEQKLLLEMLSSHEKERLLLLQANDFLKEGRFSELSRLIEQAEKQGEASPELLEYRAAPQALQALQVFCSRMPWESPEDLENAMNWLKPYLSTLEQAPAFAKFWQQQVQRLEILHKNRFTKQQDDLLVRMDQLLASNQRPAAWNALESLWQLNPAHPIFSLLDKRQRLLKENVLASLQNSSLSAQIRELALVLTWPGLNPRQQQQLLKFLTSSTDSLPKTLAGSILAAESMESPELYSIALQRWMEQPENRNLFPCFLEKALSDIFFQPGQFNARCWRTPCPNLTDFFARINQIAVNINQRKAKETR